VRRNARQDAKWPDYKNLFTKWLDAAQEACTETESVGKDETKPSAPDETDLPAVCPGRAAELDKELNDTFEKREPAPLTNREMEIAFALNDLIFGRTIIMNEGEAASVIACTGHLIPQVIALLMADITITELHLAPDFSDEEIQDVATTTLDAWSDDPNIRQQVMLDAIVEYRKPSPSKSSAPVSTSQPGNDAEPEQIIASSPTALTYRQQLTIAALNGLCANPAYYHARNSLPLMAIDLANDVIDMQDGVDAD
jgi:exodeoxyribonuclease VIII